MLYILNPGTYLLTVLRGKKKKKKESLDQLCLNWENQKAL